MEVGPVTQSGMGLAPVSWTELQAWASMTATQLSHWEAGALITASNAYLAVYNAADEKRIAAPWSDVDQNRKAVSDQIRAGFAALMGRG